MRTDELRGRRRRWVVPAVSVAAAWMLAACGAAGSAAPIVPAAAAGTTSIAPSTTTSPTPSTGVDPEGATGPGTCPTSSLAVGLGTGEGTRSGTVYRPLVFTNSGSSTCRLQGFPGVSHVAGDDGHQVGRAAAWVGPRGAAVDLPPGASAHSIISVTSADLVAPDSCRRTEVRGFRVYPPEEEAAAYVPSPGVSCSSGIGMIRVRTILPGRGDLSGATGVPDGEPEHDLGG